MLDKLMHDNAQATYSPVQQLAHVRLQRGTVLVVRIPAERSM